MRKSLFTVIFTLLTAAYAFGQATTPFQWQEKKTYSFNLNDREQVRKALHKTPGLDRHEVLPNDGHAYKWIDRVSGMPEYMVQFYNEYRAAADKVLAGGKNWLSDPTLSTEYDEDGYYYKMYDNQFTVPFTFTPYASQDDIRAAANVAYNETVYSYINEFESYMEYLFLCLNYDNPDCFWTGNEYNWTWASGTSIGYYHSTGKGELTIRLVFYYNLKTAGFDFRIQEMRNATELAKAITKHNNVVEAITSGDGLITRYDQVNYFDTWLTRNNYYNPCLVEGSSVSALAHCAFSAIGMLDEEKAPVCEGYAKAFKVLCDRLGIPCILVIGDAGPTPSTATEAHMWNLVQMDDERWYAVDVTWDDPTSDDARNKWKSGYETKKWFLLCKTDKPSYGYTFEQTHLADNAWCKGQGQAEALGIMAMPALSDYSYDPDWNSGNKDFALQDMTEYVSTSAKSYEKITYTRSYNGEWEALYVPFAINVEDVRDEFDIAEIQGINQLDENRDGKADYTLLEVSLLESVTTEANMPYLIRAKHAGTQDIVVENTMLYPARETSIDCSSVQTKYTFTGTYSPIYAAGCYKVMDGELMYGVQDESPMRWYMEATSRNGSHMHTTPARIRIMEVADVLDGIDSVEASAQTSPAIYNLQGQRLQKAQHGLNIIGGKKVMVK